MDTKTEQVHTVSSVNPFWLIVTIGLTWAPGYWAGKSVIVSPNGFWSQAHVQLGGLMVSFVLIVAAFVVSTQLVKVSRKRIQ